ncbi:spermine/spermidine synthase domain-containing protein [Ferribacterium limneticum]|uniref:spermine/spermidine synthase domain-containing protein n=1 Tax=Ferribacterium limneticum TaxID=76259 RepID=UPI001CF99F9E|nr:spermidine synthase-like protein [Ferribacterium limneticum]UCV26990.1 spermidine synthase-like protein [Ferribacterium limneticum]UCV30907.1 spermidine synthase-like protein [Ferribacterium limneticum]
MTKLYELPSPFEVETGTVLMLEPAWAKSGELRAQLLDESYPKPFVIDDGKSRFLYFNVRLMQSEMSLKAPHDLAIRYTQKMMAFLLFQPRPKRIVLIGLGGGSLIKFCHRRMPGTQLTAIELDPNVIAFRDAFMVPPDDERLQIIEADGAEYLENTEKGIDTLLVDAFDKTGFAPSLANREFFDNAYAKLSGNGVLVINLAGEKESYAGLIGEAMHVFDDQVIVISVPDDGNHVLYAFKERYFEPRWRWLHNYAKELRAKFGLDFPAFVQKMERSTKLGLARREAIRRR